MPAKRLSPFLPPLYFFILTLLYLMPLPLHWTTHVPGNEMWGDSVVNAWPFWYYPYALTHEVNSFFRPNLQFYPDGISLLQTTSNMVGAILMAPITLTLGVCAAINSWVLIHLWLGGWFFYMLVRRLGTSAVAAAFAGTAYTCSPFVTAHLAGHYTLICIGFPAMILYTGLKLYELAPEFRFRKIGLTILTGFLWAGLALTDFYLTIMTALLFMGLLIHLGQKHGFRTLLRHGFPWYLIVAMILSLLCVAPIFLKLMEQRSGAIPSDEHLRAGSDYVIDLSLLVLPTTHHWLRNLDYSRFGYDCMLHVYESGYLGLALLTVMVAGLFRKGVAKASMAWLIVGGLAFALAGGNSYTDNSPFTFLQRLLGRFWPTFFPLSEFRVPSRWIFVIQTAAAIVAAFGIDQLLKHYQPRRRLVIAGMFAFLAIDLFRPPMIGTSGPEPTSIPTSDEMNGTVLDLGIGFWSGNGAKEGDWNFRPYRRQMSHGRPILSIFTARLSPDDLKKRMDDPEIKALLELQNSFRSKVPASIPKLDWQGFAKRYNITTIRLPESFSQMEQAKVFGELMIPGIAWQANEIETVGSSSSKQ